VFEQLVHDLRMLLREIADRQPQPRAAVVDSRTLQSTPESGARAGYDGHKRRKGSKVHLAVDTLGQLLAVVMTPANEQDRIRPEVVKLPTAKHGFVLLPRRWVVERSFAWMSRFRRLARDYERLAETLAGLHFIAFALLMAHRFVTFMTGKLVG
jgi:transposase